MAGSGKLDRRNFMKAGLGAAASISGLTAAGAVLDKESNGSFSNGDGEFHALYGAHRSGSEPYEASNLPDDLDGFFVENTADYLENSLEHLEYFQESQPYSDILGEMAENNTPVYMADVNLSSDARVAETGVMAGEASLGAGLLAAAGVGEGFSKKDGLMSGLAGWLIQPVASYAAFLQNPESETAGEFVDASNEVHPESFRLTRDFRNNVVAYKQLELMARKGEDDCYGSAWGSLHEGFENSLERGKEKLLEDIESTRDIWEPFVENEETVYKATEFNQYSGEWYVEEVHEFPELRKVLE